MNFSFPTADTVINKQGFVNLMKTLITAINKSITFILNLIICNVCLSYLFAPVSMYLFFLELTLYFRIGGFRYGETILNITRQAFVVLAVILNA